MLSPIAAPKPSTAATLTPVHHWHLVPHRTRYIAPTSLSRSRDDAAVTRNLAPLAFILVKAAKATAAPGPSILLPPAIAWVWGFGVREGIHTFILQRRTLKRLQSEQRLLTKHRDALRASPWSASAVRAHRAALELLLKRNRRDQHDAHIVSVFGGGVATAATLGVGVGQLLQPGLLGSLPGVAAASMPTLCVAVPLLATFSAGIAAWQAVRFGQTFRVGRAPRTLRHADVVPFAPGTERLLRRRLREKRGLLAASGCSHVALAVGAPLTLFVGPIGLAVLVPGALGNFFADVETQDRLKFPAQLPLAAKAQLTTPQAFTNEVRRAWEHEQILDALRARKRLLYPKGQLSRNARPFVEVAAFVRRHAQPTAVREMPPPGPILHAYFRASNRSQIVFEQAHLRILREQLNSPLARRDRAWATDLFRDAESAQRYVAHLQRRGARLDGPAGPLRMLRRLHHTIVREQLLTPYAGKVLADRYLRFALLGSGVELHKRQATLDLKVMMQALRSTNPPFDVQKVTNRCLALGEKVLLCTGRKQWRWRRKETLDLLADYLVVQRKKP